MSSSLTPLSPLSSQFLKYVNLRQHYSLEFAMWLIFAFGPYFLAEGLQLSGQFHRHVYEGVVSLA